MKDYYLRVVDRGLVNGVPVVNVYLERVDGPARCWLMYSGDLSPASAEELAAGLGELGVRVEREAVPSLDPARKAAAAKRKAKGEANEKTEAA